MTKRERVVAALGGQPVDRPPVAFWRHAPDVDHTAKGLAEAMLSFHRRFHPPPPNAISRPPSRIADLGGRGPPPRAPRGAQPAAAPALPPPPGRAPRPQPAPPGRPPAP